MIIQYRDLRWGRLLSKTRNHHNVWVLVSALFLWGGMIRCTGPEVVAGIELFQTSGTETRNGDHPIIVSSPALGKDGTIYLGSPDGMIYAFRNDHSLKWKYRTEGPVVASPALGVGELVYIGSEDGFLYVLDRQGTLLWKFKTGGPVLASPALGADSVVYQGATDGRLYAITPEGKLKWKFETSGPIVSSPAVAADGTIYFGSTDGYFYALTPAGLLKWKFKTGGEIKSSPAISREGKLFFGSGDGFIYSLSPKGTPQWKYKTSAPVISSPAIGEDSSIYVGSLDGNFYALHWDGTLKWKFQAGGSIQSSPAVAGDGCLYFGADDHSLYALKPDGTLKWSFKFDERVISSPNIASDGTIYVGAGKNYYYSLSTDSHGLATSAWPKFGRDSGNTRRRLRRIFLTKPKTPLLSFQGEIVTQLTIDTRLYLLSLAKEYALVETEDGLRGWLRPGTYQFSAPDQVRPLIILENKIFRPPYLFLQGCVYDDQQIDSVWFDDVILRRAQSATTKGNFEDAYPFRGRFYVTPGTHFTVRARDGSGKEAVLNFKLDEALISIQPRLTRLVTKTAANVRLRPGARARIIKILRAGAPLWAVGNHAEWYLLDSGGWIHQSVVRTIPANPTNALSIAIRR